MTRMRLELPARPKARRLAERARWTGRASAAACALLLCPGWLGDAGAAVPIGAEFQINVFTTGHQDHPAVVGDLSGGFLVVWESDGVDGSGAGVRARRFDSTGTALAGEIPVNSYTTGNQSWPAVARRGTAGFWVVWQSYGQGVFGRKLGSSGSPVGGEFKVNTTTSSARGRPAIASDPNGAFAVVWESFGQDGSFTGLFGRRFDSGGNTQASEFAVNTYTTGWQGVADIAREPNGRFVVVWTTGSEYKQTALGTTLGYRSQPDGSDSGVSRRRFDGSTALDPNENIVNVFTTGFQGYPSVARTQGGSFVVVWQSGKFGTGKDGSGAGISARWFESSGAASGSEFVVNTHTTGLQAHPDVAMEPGDEAIVAVWESFGQDGSRRGVFGRRMRKLDPNQPLGCEFPVNTHTDGEQSRPSVAMTGSGITRECAFVVSWTSSDPNDVRDGLLGGIFGRRFDPSAPGCQPGDRAYCCPWPISSFPHLPAPILECPVRWTGIWTGSQGAPSLGCPEGLCASRFSAGGYSPMLNERHQRATDAVWGPQAATAMLPGIGSTSQPYPLIPDIDLGQGSAGDVRIDGYPGVCNTGLVGKLCATAPALQHCMNRAVSPPDPGSCVVDSVCSAGNIGKTGCRLPADCDQPSGAGNGLCVHLEVDPLCGKDVCSAETCGAGAPCVGTPVRQCLMFAGAATGRCVCSTSGTCGAMVGPCVMPEAIWPLMDDCLPHELRDTWKCADCNWHQASGAPPCNQVVDTNCPARDPNLNSGTGVLAVHARSVTDTSGVADPLGGRAIIGSPVYPWLIVPDPRDTCGDCDLSCLNTEGVLAHELGHVFSLEHPDPNVPPPDSPLMVGGGIGLEILPADVNQARTYLQAQGSTICQTMPVASVPLANLPPTFPRNLVEPSADVPSASAALERVLAARSPDRMGQFLEPIEDTLPGEPSMDIEKVLVVARSLGAGTPGAGEQLELYLGIAGILPVQAALPVFEWAIDTDGDPTTPRQPPPGLQAKRTQVPWPMPGADRLIRIELSPVWSISTDGEPQFSTDTEILVLGDPRAGALKLSDTGPVEDGARIVYMSRRGRMAGGSGPDKVPVRSEIKVVLEDPRRALGLPAGAELFQDGLRFQVATSGASGAVADLAPDGPIVLALRAQAAPRIDFPGQAVRGHSYPLAVGGFPPLTVLRISLGGALLDARPISGPDGSTQLQLLVPPETPLGTQSLSVYMEDPNSALGAATLVNVVDPPGKGSNP